MLRSRVYTEILNNKHIVRMNVPPILKRIKQQTYRADECTTHSETNEWVDEQLQALKIR